MIADGNASDVVESLPELLRSFMDGYCETKNDENRKLS